MTSAAVFLLAFFSGVTAAFAESAITVIPDVSFIIQIGNFILLVVLLNVVLYKPIRGILAQRKEKIEGLGQSIQSSQSLVSEKEDEFNSGIREARSKGVALKDALVEQASQEEKKILGEINEKAQADLAEVREKIAKDVESVRKKLQKEIDAFSGAIFEKILGRAV
ncbi:MAG: ATP synthase F0 subunit B [Proteobacteria bacterium]|nr:ATP synthase F0 subunit B [Pseudomonadota bacterium]